MQFTGSSSNGDSPDSSDDVDVVIVTHRLGGMGVADVVVSPDKRLCTPLCVLAPAMSAATVRVSQ